MRDRLLMPLLIPLGAAASIVLLILSGAKILLDLDPAYATVVAICVAIGILLISTLVAVGPRLRAPQLYVLTALPVSVLLAVGLYLTAQPQPKSAAEGTVEATTAIAEVATDNAFSVKAATVPTGTEITLTIDNKGQASHNWHLLGVQNKDGSDIKTQLIGNGAQDTIKFTLDAPGAFNFQCDVHPAEMRGKLTAAAGVQAAGPQKDNTVTATDNKFDKKTLTVKANEPSTITLVNKGQATHNIHILNAKNPDGTEPKGALIGGGQQDVLSFTIATPGTYDYQCDVHPTEMRGKLTVQ